MTMVAEQQGSATPVFLLTRSDSFAFKAPYSLLATDRASSAVRYDAKGMFPGVSARARFFLIACDKVDMQHVLGNPLETGFRHTPARASLPRSFRQSSSDSPGSTHLLKPAMAAADSGCRLHATLCAAMAES